MWDPSNEAFGMTDPGGLKGPPALVQHALGSMVVDIVQSEHCDPAMAMLGVVPREERSAEGDCGGDVVKAPREAGVVLQGLELRLGERVVIGHLGAVQRAGDPEVGEQLCGALARHRRPTVGVQGDLWGWTPCLWQVSSMRRPASAEFSRSATIQPTA